MGTLISRLLSTYKLSKRKCRGCRKPMADNVHFGFWTATFCSEDCKIDYRADMQAY